MLLELIEDRAQEKLLTLLLTYNENNYNENNDKNKSNSNIDNDTELDDLDINIASFALIDLIKSLCRLITLLYTSYINNIEITSSNNNNNNNNNDDEDFDLNLEGLPLALEALSALTSLIPTTSYGNQLRIEILLCVQSTIHKEILETCVAIIQAWGYPAMKNYRNTTNNMNDIDNNNNNLKTNSSVNKNMNFKFKIDKKRDCARSSLRLISNLIYKCTIGQVYNIYDII